MIKLYEIEGLFPNISQEGFSVFLSSFSASASAYFTGWTSTTPYFTTSNFSTTNGIYTVPVTGVYAVTATINYVTNSAITASIGSSVSPSVIMRRTSPTSTDLVSGLLPLENISLTLLTLRAVLGGAAITLSGVVSLSKADLVRLYYNSSTMTVALTFQNMTWTIYRLS